MAIDITGPVTLLVRTALDASSLRHEAISTNIANINTPGFKSLKVSFENQLQDLISSSQYKSDEVLKNRMKNTTPFIFETTNEQQMNQLDVEMVDMAKNTIHYQTLLKGLRGYGSIVKMAIKEGRS